MLIISSAYTQDVTGYWQGQLNTNLSANGASRSFFVNMVLKQTGKKVDGRFSTSHLDFPNNPYVVFEISGIIGKKDKIPTRLMRGNILYNRLSDVEAQYFLEFDDIQYVKNDTMEVIYGNWTANGLKGLRPDGTAGSFWVKKLTTISVSQKDSINNQLHQN